MFHTRLTNVGLRVGSWASVCTLDFSTKSEWSKLGEVHNLFFKVSVFPGISICPYRVGEGEKDTSFWVISRRALLQWSTKVKVTCQHSSEVTVIVSFAEFYCSILPNPKFWRWKMKDPCPWKLSIFLHSVDRAFMTIIEYNFLQSNKWSIADWQEGIILKQYNSLIPPLCPV